MSAPPKFEHEILRRIRRQHPGATGREWAWMVTEEVRRQTGDQSFEVSSGTIRAIVDRNRDRWDDEDAVVLPVKPKGARTQPFTGVSDTNSMPLRYVRILTRIARGDTVGIPQRDRNGAENFGRQLREHCQVVDVTPDREVYVRNARPDEVDGEGRIFTYMARHPGLTDAEWKQLPAEARAVVSAKFLAENFEAPPVAEPADLNSSG